MVRSIALAILFCSIPETIPSLGMQILSKKQNGDIEQADKIMIQLISTDESLPITQRIIKRSEKEGLYNAIEIANIWLERILSEK